MRPCTATSDDGWMGERHGLWMHAFFFAPGPPNFGLSMQLRQTPQSGVVQPVQLPQRTKRRRDEALLAEVCGSCIIISGALSVAYMLDMPCASAVAIGGGSETGAKDMSGDSCERLAPGDEIGCTQRRCSHACFLTLAPPNFFLSMHALHEPQSVAWQPAQRPHRRSLLRAASSSALVDEPLIRFPSTSSMPWSDGRFVERRKSSSRRWPDWKRSWRAETALSRSCWEDRRHNSKSESAVTEVVIVADMADVGDGAAALITPRTAASSVPLILLENRVLRTAPSVPVSCFKRFPASSRRACVGEKMAAIMKLAGNRFGLGRRAGKSGVGLGRRAMFMGSGMGPDGQPARVGAPTYVAWGLCGVLLAGCWAWEMYDSENRPPEPSALPESVERKLENGTYLMRDGSIRKDLPCD